MKKTKTKRNKVYVPRPTMFPKIIPVTSLLESERYLPLELNGLVESAIEYPSIDSMQNMGEKLVILAEALCMKFKRRSLGDQRDPASLAICSAIATYRAVSDRFDRTGAVAVSAIEAKTLRAGVPVLHRALQDIPAKMWYDAEAVCKAREEALRVYLIAQQKAEKVAA